jgi:serine/threonine protein kinase
MVDNKSNVDLKIIKSNFVNYKNGSITKDYNFGKTIGSGAFGTVKEAFHKITKQTRAVKV